uniref:Uncharacterized protein n=1 Tax=Trypanosoma congolense (strain IL3000) TaxID=1068625 RepID=G0UVW3_TRYCI|nr:conserved hypothetical protein [Trypanosoma congolense IL3000]
MTLAPGSFGFLRRRPIASFLPRRNAAVLLFTAAHCASQGRKLKHGEIFDAQAPEYTDVVQGTDGAIGKMSSSRGALFPAPASPSATENVTLELHRRLATASQQSQGVANRSTVSVSSNTTCERIERRRKKWSVAESEFDVRITERLFPEIRRLTALHELHYSDAVMREVDASSYFSHVGAAPPSNAAKSIAEGEITSGDDTACDVLTDADFLNFETEELAAGESVLSRSVNEEEGTPTGDGGGLPQVEGNEKVIAHGLQTPWFVPPDGVVQLRPLPLEDLLCLLRFLMHLRMQSVKDLPLALQAKVRATEKLLRKENPTKASVGGMVDRKIMKRGDTVPISFEDIMTYIDQAPSPVIGFSENLPLSNSPAFVFTLYTENVSLQNAIGHMAALFAVPQRAFFTCTAVSKMSCGAVLCTVAHNHLSREHLLLLNTMCHPGFVLRVGSIQEVRDVEQQNDLTGSLARWQPLHEVGVLLRRVSCNSRQEIEHRLRAIQDVGAVFFCSNREASLARAATDVLHGFYKSALVNALHRRNAPLELRHFLKRPNIVTAARARRVSSDPTVRQTLKNYELTGGNWEQTVGRTPYVWRRRWMNALRGSVWNTMASRRLAAAGGGRQVIPGDAVLRPEYRMDAHRRMITTVKADHIMIVRSREEAAQCSVEDIFIPFLRGTYPPGLFASDDTEHPIMTRTNMLALLRELHAPQLLLGMNEVCSQLLDARGGSSPLLFRRFIIRPITMSFTILEDKPPMKSVHFDAARLLLNDRLRLQPSLCGGAGRPLNISNQVNGDYLKEEAPSLVPSLVDQHVVLEKTTIGSRLSSGVLAEEFFSAPSRQDYVALGHVKRHLHGNFVSAVPQTSDDAMGAIDRLYSVHIHAVLRNGLGALSQLLREYFILSGVEAESDSALQHKIHRMRRELDGETDYLAAPTFCRACYCRCHDALESCAEYQHKREKHLEGKRRQKSLQQLGALSERTLPGTGSPVVGLPGEVDGVDDDGRIMDKGKGVPSTSMPQLQSNGEFGPSKELELELTLRRRTGEQKWGIHLTSSLSLFGIDDVGVVVGGKLRFGHDWDDNVNAGMQLRRVWLLSGGNESMSSLKLTDNRALALRQFISTALCSDDSDGHSAPATADICGMDNETLKKREVVLPNIQRALSTAISTLSALHTGKTSGCGGTTESPSLLHSCCWTLKKINGIEVSGRRQVASVFVSMGKERQACLLFRARVNDDLAREEKVETAQADDRYPQLPNTIELTLTKDEHEGDCMSGWGLKVDSALLTLQNLSDFLAPGGRNGVTATVNPPLSDGLKGGTALDKKYVLRTMDGVAVASQRDVCGHMSTRNTTDGRGNILVLKLELKDPQEVQKQPDECLTPRVMPDSSQEVVGNHMDIIAEASKSDVKAIADASKCEAVGSGGCDSGMVALPPCSPQCVRLSPVQLRRSVFTIAINRSSDAPSGRWGIRVQRGTTRIQRIQHDRHFSFQVYASKRNQAVRVADNLRAHSTRQNSGGVVAGDRVDEPETTPKDDSTSAVSYSHFVYFIVGVNYHRLASAAELRTSLADAARSQAESVILNVQQYRLAYIALSIRRSKLEGEEGLEAVGMRVSRDMVILAVVPGSAMARSILEATHENCSLRRLIVSERNADETSVTKTRRSEMNLSTQNNTWQFDLDEDALEQRHRMSSGEGDASLCDAVAGDDVTVGEFTAHWNMVDGVALCELHDRPESVTPLWSRARFVWRVLYAARAGSLRTPQDMARAFAGDVQEETIFVQQCVIDD